jgi:hypothetical protein
MSTAESMNQIAHAMIPHQSGKLISPNQFVHVVKDCAIITDGSTFPVFLGRGKAI